MVIHPQPGDWQILEIGECALQIAVGAVIDTDDFEMGIGLFAHLSSARLILWALLWPSMGRQEYLSVLLGVCCGIEHKIKEILLMDRMEY